MIIGKQAALSSLLGRNRNLWRGMAVIALNFQLMCSAAQAQVIEEIVVTAQKREQSIQEVPISMQAMSGEFLRRSQVTDLRDLQTFVPSLKIATTANPRNATISIRGVGTSGVNAGIEQSVAVYVDDVYYVRPASAIQDLVDISSIEVLRGPQGTLYGRNNSVGSIKVMTAAPTQESESEVSFSLGSNNLRRASGFVSGGLSDTVSARLSMFIRERDGYDKNTYLNNLGRNNDETLNDENSYGLRGQIAWAGETTDVRLIADYAQKETTCCTPDFAIVTPGLIAFSDRVVAGTGNPNRAFDNFKNFDNRLQSFVPPRSTEDNYGLSAHVNHELSGGWLAGSTLTSVTSYRKSEIEADQFPTGLPMDLLYSNDTETTTTASEELRITSPLGESIDWVTGVYLYYQESTFDTLTYFGPDFQYTALARSRGFDPAVNSGPAQGATLDGVLETLSYSGFAQGTWQATERLALTAGARITHDKKDANVINGNDNSSPAVIAALPTSVFDRSRSDTETTWQFTAEYAIAEDTLIYATASKGFKSGGFNARRLREGTQFEFESEVVKNYELGLKRSWLEDRVISNVTYFRMPVTGFQSSQQNPQGTGVIVDNVGDLRQQGVEVELQANPIDRLTLAASVAWLDSEYTDFDAAPCARNGGGPPSTTLAGACDLTGFPIDGAPEWSASMVGTYQAPVLNTAMNWFGRAEFRFVDEHFQDQDLSTQSLQKSYRIWNFRLGLAGADEKWRITGYVENAFDEDYALATLQTVFGGPIGATGSYVTFNGPPRTAGIEARVRF
jgi:iron complex outermembrane receptor protein